MKRILVIVFLCHYFTDLCAQEYLLKSPDENLKVEVVVSANTVYRVYHRGTLIMHGKPTGLTLDKNTHLGKKEYEPTTTTNTVNEVRKPVVAYRQAEITEHYNELTLAFKSGLGIEFRCFNHGFAYRLTTTFKDEITIKEESMGFELTGNPTVWFPQESSFTSHNERKYLRTTSMELKKGKKASLPVLWAHENGPFIHFTETDLRNYPGMYLKTDGMGGYAGVHPKYPAATIKLFDRYQPATFNKPYIAKTSGTRSYPWRVFTITDNEADLLNTHLPWLLANENKLASTQWIIPGKVAWDWWNALQLEGVDFKPGLNTQTYKYYIDFAAANNLEYIIMDEGWYKLGDLTKVKPEIDMQEIIAYASSKNVGVILWVVWRTLKNQFDVAFNQFSQWGVAGIKMDFMLRNDQEMIAFYEKVAQEAANRLMLVNFHGSHAPKGLQRTYPNVLTFEGLRGLEWNKWSSALTPEHDLILPFTRMVAGPMDYTPGAMENLSLSQKHTVNFKNPKSQGTRCHELAKYVVYESPLQMLADAPTAYQTEVEAMQFLSQVPTVWDQTIVLEAKVGEYILLARKKDDKWFIGGMTGASAQTKSIDLSFLGDGEFEMDVWRDGDNTQQDGTSYEFYHEAAITAEMKYVVSMAPGGGWVAAIRKK